MHGCFPEAMSRDLIVTEDYTRRDHHLDAHKNSNEWNRNECPFSNQNNNDDEDKLLFQITNPPGERAIRHLADARHTSPHENISSKADAPLLLFRNSSGESVCSSSSSDCIPSKECSWSSSHQLISYLPHTNSDTLPDEAATNHQGSNLQTNSVQDLPSTSTSSTNEITSNSKNYTASLLHDDAQPEAAGPGCGVTRGGGPDRLATFIDPPSHSAEVHPFFKSAVFVAPPNPIIQNHSMVPVRMRPGYTVPYFSPGRSVKAGTYGELLWTYDPILNKQVVVKKIMFPSKFQGCFIPPLLREVHILQSLNVNKHIVELQHIMIGTEAFQTTGWQESREHPNLYLPANEGFDCSFIFPAALNDCERWDYCELADGLPNCNSIYMTFEAMDADLAEIIECQTPELGRIIQAWSPDGSSVRRNRFTLSIRNIKSIVYQILIGLNEMVTHQFVHRDIKPHNILLKFDEVSRNAIVKLADFGLARHVHHASGWPNLQRDKRHDVTHGVCTLWYRAPELILHSETHDYSLDVWSLGVVVYQMFMKLPPWSALTSETGILYDIISKFGLPKNELYRSFEGWSDLMPRIPPRDPKDYFREHFAQNFKAFDDMSIDERDDLADFIGSMFNMMPEERPLPATLLNHRWLKEIRHQCKYMERFFPDECPFGGFTAERVAHLTETQSVRTMVTVSADNTLFTPLMDLASSFSNEYIDFAPHSDEGVTSLPSHPKINGGGFPLLDDPTYCSVEAVDPMLSCDGCQEQIHKLHQSFSADIRLWQSWLEQDL
eukprot:GHVH01006470.1.p1 GENE.GHVH01006470.1~~GHVH01006470.1.p1  ORF type:complete len:776 (+),score=90.40 GHVH01006470.1:270-2597(+)